MRGDLDGVASGASEFADDAVEAGRHAVEKMGGGKAAPFAEENIEQTRRAVANGFDFEIAPAAASTDGFGKMGELLADGTAVFAARSAPAASRDECGARLCGVELANEMCDFRVVFEPIEAEFDGWFGAKSGRGFEGKDRFELPPHGRGVGGRNDGADFVFGDHRLRIVTARKIDKCAPASERLRLYKDRKADPCLFGRQASPPFREGARDGFGMARLPATQTDGC